MPSNSSTFYTGVWINHAKGPILGATLTVKPRDGLILVAILALFVSLAGSQSWLMIRFLAHQYRATNRPRHGIYYQQQAVLRNTGVASAAIWNFGKIAWIWHTKGVASFRKSIGLLLLGLSHLSLFIAAGVFSSSLARVDNEVLIRSKNCGEWAARIESVADLTDDLTEATDYMIHRRENADLSKEYTQECLNGYESSPQCNLFKKTALPYTTDFNAPCPFDSKMCLGPENGAFKLTTDFLDSRDDFGVNANPKDRVQYRKTMTCSPLATEGYVVSGNSSIHGRGFNYTAAYYGTNNYMNASLAGFGGMPNATYVHTDYKSIALGYDQNLANERYSIATVMYSENSLGFAPLPEMFFPNGTTTLFFATFYGAYLQPSDDLWLSAHKEIVQYMGTSSNLTKFIHYGIDKPISVLGCVEQNQVCNPNKALDSPTRCTPFLGPDVLEVLDMTEIFDTTNQMTTMNILLQAMLNTPLEVMVPTMSSPLIASEYLMDMTSTKLPSNQWILEVTAWFATSLNLVQRYVSEVATGPPGKYGAYTANSASNDTELQWFCNNMIMRDNGYTCFSVLAISLVLGLGGFIICASLFFESMVGWLQFRFGRGLYRRVSWNLDSALQLQRMAFEEAGLGTWERCGHEIPVTVEKEKIQVATEWDEWHPSIRGREPAAEPTLHISAEKSAAIETCERVDSIGALSEASTAISPAESLREVSMMKVEVAPATEERP